MFHGVGTALSKGNQPAPGPRGVVGAAGAGAPRNAAQEPGRTG